MNDINIGTYVEYKDTPYIVIGMKGNTCKLMSPVTGNRNVLQSNCTVLSYEPAQLITCRGNDYLVTARKLIISLTTGKMMKWPADHGIRLDILSAAK